MNSNTSKPHFAFYTAAELIAQPPMEWRIKDVLPVSGLACLFGPSGSGKSFLATDLVAAIAEGGPWFGHQTATGRVLCMVLEGQAGFRKRLHAWEVHKQRPFPVGTFFFVDSFSLNDENEVTTLEMAIQVVRGFDVVVIDTLNRAAPNADENSSQHMNQLIGAATKLQKATKGLVVLVHHTGKDQSRGMRGHSSLHAAMDSVIEVTNSQSFRMWKLIKSKDGEEGVSSSFSLQSIELPSSTETSCVIVPSDQFPTSNKPRQPTGTNQIVALQEIEKWHAKQQVSGSMGSVSMSARLSREDAIRLTGPLLLKVKPERRKERAAEAIKGLAESGFIRLTDDNYIELPL